MVLSAGQLALPAALLGVGSHVGYFVRGEHHTSAFQLFLSLVFGPPAIFWLFLALLHYPFLQSFQAATTICLSFLVSLTASILTYRFFLHPLSNYPGPAAARLSKFWHSRLTASKYNNFELLGELHAKHGDYVRTGPNEVSIIDPIVVDAVHGPQSKCTKGPWYDQSLPLTSIHQMRDRALHDKRRRCGWDKAFNIKSLRAYDSRVIAFSDLLLQRIDSFAGRPVDVSHWFNFFSYDVMGSLAFGRSFDTLKTGGSHKFIDIIKGSMDVLKILNPVPWVISIASKIPGDANPIVKMIKYSEECIQERKRQTPDEMDVVGHLIEADKFFEDPLLDYQLLTGDSRLIIIAGSDTTATALTYTFWYIARDPSIAEKIRAELKENGIKNDETFSILALQNLPYLNGVINEGLRLHPPVPSGVFRLSPPEGLQLGKRFVPGGVNILTPTYVMQRSPDSFVQPDKFIPERWSTKPELIVNKNVFMPFSTGPYGCIGKNLALGELRTVVSKLVTEFDVRLAPNETGEALFRGEKDVFTLQPGKLNLCFVRRNDSN